MQTLLVTLSCVDGEVTVPRQLLSCQSPVFEDLLSCCENESGSTTSSIVITVDDLAACWEVLRDVMLGNVEKISWYNAETLYRLSDKYNMVQCCSLITRELCSMARDAGEGLSCTCAHASYALVWLNMAERHQLQELYQICMEFVQAHLCDIEAVFLCQRGHGPASGPAPPLTCDLPQEAGLRVHGDGGGRIHDDVGAAAPGTFSSGSGTNGSSTAQSRDPLGPTCCALGERCRCISVSERTHARLMRSAVVQLGHYKKMWEGVCQTLDAEGLGYDMMQGQVRIMDWARWRRLPPTSNSVRRSYSVGLAILPAGDHTHQSLTSTRPDDCIVT